MKLNRKLVLFLSLVLSLALATGGTLAYLSDTDADVNTMTLGNVQIEQLEYERVTNDGHELTNDAWVSTGETDKYGYTPDKIQEYTQNKPLYPAVFADGAIDWDGRVPGHQQSWGQINAPGSNQLFDDSVKNTVDKFVFVKNTGKSDAYVRTWFAFEQGSLTADEFDKLIGTNADNSHWSWKTIATNVELAGPDGATSTYVIACATYVGPTSNPTGILKPGEVTYPSLLQVYMHPEATNEDVENVDGNKSGRYDIIVVTQAIQAAGFDKATDALNEGFGTEHPFTELEYKDEMDDAYAEKPDIDHWDGTVDTTWYNDTDTEFVLTTAEQLAGFAKLVDDGNTFAGKTVKLDIDLCLGCGEEDGCDTERSFDPIGSYAFETAFMGTFDGQDHTVMNMYQSGWALENGLWDGDDCGLGLFGLVEDATIKNFKIDGANLPSECNLIGFVAGTAYGDMLFENITITNSYSGNHSYYSGGIVGWASGSHKYINCNVDETNVISSQWGDFNNALGGIIGGAGSNGSYHFEDCNIACVLDAYNDVVSAYEWYSYRNTGMLIGNSGHTTTNSEGTTFAAAPNVTCKNVTVTYGDWANYHYCKFSAMSYPWVRVEAGESENAYGNPRYDYATDANGNKVVDENHVHNDGEGHNELIVLDQLFGGPSGDRYCTYGMPTHDGVTVVYNNK